MNISAERNERESRKAHFTVDHAEQSSRVPNFHTSWNKPSARAVRRRGRNKTMITVETGVSLADYACMNLKVIKIQLLG
jgi:hypothetical protein